MDRIENRYEEELPDSGVRPAMIVLGVGLGILWLVGLGYHASAWMVWIELALACASILSVLMPDTMFNALRASPFAIGGALIVLWIVGLAVGVQTWLAWWTFGFGIAYLFAGAALTVGVTRTTRTTTYRSPNYGPPTPTV